jgi:hypothetical protein
MLPPTAQPPASQPPRLLDLQPWPPTPYTATPILPSSLHLALAYRLAGLRQLLFAAETAWFDQPLPSDEKSLLNEIETFLMAVNTHYFPVFTELSDYALRDSQWQLEQIPIVLHGIDPFYSDYGSGNYKEPLQLMLLLAEWGYGHDEATFGSLQATYPAYQFPLDFDLDELAEVLDEMDLVEPLVALPDLIRMIGARTGNPWLDYSNGYAAECGCYPEWEAYEAWYEAWQTAAPIAARVDALLDWTEEQQQDRLDVVVESLLAAYSIWGTRSPSAEVR